MSIEKAIATAVLELLKPDLDEIKSELERLKNVKIENELPERPTRREVAAYFKKTVAWVDKKVREGKLKKYGEGRTVFFLRDEIKSFALDKE